MDLNTFSFTQAVANEMENMERLSREIKCAARASYYRTLAKKTEIKNLSVELRHLKLQASQSDMSVQYFRHNEELIRNLFGLNSILMINEQLKQTNRELKQELATEQAEFAQILAEHNQRIAYYQHKWGEVQQYRNAHCSQMSAKLSVAHEKLKQVEVELQKKEANLREIRELFCQLQREKEQSESLDDATNYVIATTRMKLESEELKKKIAAKQSRFLEIMSKKQELSIKSAEPGHAENISVKVEPRSANGPAENASHPSQGPPFRFTDAISFDSLLAQLHNENTSIPQGQTNEVQVKQEPLSPKTQN